MVKLFCGLLLLAGCAAGQDKVSRMGQITFDPYAGVLTWTVQQGTIDKNRDFKSSKESKYSINFPSATMSDGKETRKFSRNEAHDIYELFNAVLTRYARESTSWWIDPPKAKAETAEPVTKL
jgi:hypothetical protein